MLSVCCNKKAVPQPQEGEGSFICEGCQHHCEAYNPQTGPKNIDWVEAKKFYLNDATHTYADVAKKFDVSTWSVEQMGSKEGWVKTRQELGEKALEEFEENKKAMIAEASDRHIKVWRSLQGEIIKTMKNDQGKLTSAQLLQLSNSLKRVIDGERVILGLPTSVAKQELNGSLTVGDKKLDASEIAEIDQFQKRNAENTGNN